MVHSIENTNPKTFTNVRVFAGDKKPAADASYRNLLWENFPVDHRFDIGTKVQNNKEIGTIDSWGPFFRVSFDLIIHSLHPSNRWTSLLAFRGNGAVCNNCEYGDMVPAIFIDNLVSKIQISNNVDEHLDDHFQFKIELNRWYNIIIEQKSPRAQVLRL